MDILAVIGLGLITAVMCVLLRQIRPEYALLLSLAAGAVIMFGLISLVEEIAGRIDAILSLAEVPSQYIQVLFKALGICFITQLACDTCKDAGESAISSRLEMAGKVAVLAVSLPLFEQVLSVVQRLILPG